MSLSGRGGSSLFFSHEYETARGSRIKWTTYKSMVGIVSSRYAYKGTFEESTITLQPVLSRSAWYNASKSPKYRATRDASSRLPEGVSTKGRWRVRVLKFCRRIISRGSTASNPPKA